MHIKIAAGVAVVAGGLIVIAAREGAGRPWDQSQPPAAITLTGCLRQGSAAGVFLLRGAAAAGQEEPPRDHLVVRPAEGVDLSAHLNQRLAITGQVWRAPDGPPPPEGANTVERALRRLEARKLAVVADKCSED